MTLKNISKYIMLLPVVALWQCEPSIDEFTPTKGDADFTTFVALGDSYGSGYTDGALSREGQESSYVAILAQQMQNVGLGEFNQPLLPEGTSVGSSGNGSFYLKSTGNPAMPVAPETNVQGNAELLTDPSTWINTDGPYHNVSVPGARTYHLLTPVYGNPLEGNPYYARFASNPGTSTMLEDALSNNPTFFSCWLAGNDVLGYALSGGEGGVGTGPADYTDEATFTFAMNTLVESLTVNGAKGVIGNIPDIGAIPFFNTVPYNALPLDQATADILNAAYADYNTGAFVMDRDSVKFMEGANALIIEDSDYPLALGKRRQIKPTEKFLLTLPVSKIKEEGWGTQVPIPEEYVLDETELENIRNATARFNEIVEDLASEHGLAFVDAHTLMENVKNGLSIDGNTYTAAFVTGGAFSLDGVHTTARGSAMIANEFIKAINKQYGSCIPMANINDYPTVEFP